jgi:3-dehydroquinate synthase
MVGSGMAHDLSRVLKKQVGAGRLFVFYDANFYALHGLKLRKSIKLSAGRIFEMVVPSGEKMKSRRTVARLQDYLLGEKISRDDFVLACGGGVTSDLVGFVAASTLRGIRWGVVSTTLLGMVDAAIGGKTGINHLTGKNLIGAFWQPSFVALDIAYLATLPRRQVIAGLGEVLKTAGLDSEQQVRRLGKYLSAGDLFDQKSLSRMVSSCAGYKAKVVEQDERESGRRMVLNFGHTFGHGIEKALGFGRLLHGEAVILGIDAALNLGERLGHTSPALRVYRELVTSLLPFLPKRKIDPDEVLIAMALDKKRSATDQRYVLLKQVGQPLIGSKIPGRLVRASLLETLEKYQRCGGQRA